MNTLSDNHIIVISILIKYYCLNELKEIETDCLKMGLLSVVERLLEIAESKYDLDDCNEEKIDYIIRVLDDLEEAISEAIEVAIFRS